MTTPIFTLRSTEMNLLQEQLSRAQCRQDREAADTARVVRALRMQKRANRLSRKAHKASQRAALRAAVLSA
ncbi:hypothetical protein [Thalassiella azotivora]